MTKNKNHHLEKQSDRWYFVTMINGKRFRKSLLTSSVTEAREGRDAYLKEIQISGDIQRTRQRIESPRLFGEVVEEWARITATEVKSSTFQDYRYTMNSFILPWFGNMIIGDINYMDIKNFISGLTCSAKRKNNIMVPLRSVFKMAFLSEIIDKNPMERVKNLKIIKPDIMPMSMDEVRLLLDHVAERYRNFFTAAFFTGMRFGEMSGLKWKNVDFQRRLIKVRETRVKGEEGRPKTKKSVRDIKMLPPVIEALGIREGRR